jgi:hypothetical protein
MNIPGHSARLLPLLFWGGCSLALHLTAILSPASTRLPLSPSAEQPNYSETGGGAKDPRLNHWAYLPLIRPSVPAVSNPEWVRNPIDAFILARLESENLAPAPLADRLTLLRRLTFGLHGLPPAVEQLDEFLDDSSPQATTRLIDQLLASPHYGERWARHWLDLVRFCESQGFERDKIRDHSWRYRDYVIDSFNSDKSYFQFVREQIAGDLLEPVTPEGIIATGFLVAGPWDEVGHNQAGAVMKARVREDELENTIASISQTFLGLTLNCARCHDHVYDPISLHDYYRFKSALDGVHHGDRPILPANQFSASSNNNPPGPLAYAANPRQPQPTPLLPRGDVEQPGEIVSPSGLPLLSHLDPEFGLAPDAPESQRRLKLAEWVTHPRNPLLARVLVNRLWQYHFGRGLVATPNDFGLNGAPPSHPELLDWLAAEFIAQGGTLKPLHKLILLSHTYQQSSRFHPTAAAHDSENQLLSRFTPRRLESEAVRDAMLAISGQINLAQGGPGYRQFDVYVNNSWFYTWADHHGPEFNRRTVYRLNVQSARDPLLDPLDCPDIATQTPVRNVTTTPLQALALMNNSFVLRQADHFAQRLRNQAPADLPGQIQFAWRLALGRSPTPGESTAAAALAREHGLESVCWALFNSSEFLYVR